MSISLLFCNPGRGLGGGWEGGASLYDNASCLQTVLWIIYGENLGNQGTIGGRMIETGNYNKSRDRGVMVPTITLAHVQPQYW